MVTCQHFQKGFPLLFVAFVADVLLLPLPELLPVLLQEFASLFDREGEPFNLQLHTSCFLISFLSDGSLGSYFSSLLCLYDLQDNDCDDLDMFDVSEPLYSLFEDKLEMLTDDSIQGLTNLGIR
jgi:hypothetical protein